MGHRWRVGRAALVSGSLAALAAAQQTPPISGVTGTVALEGTVEKEYAGANTVIVKTMDGVEHVFHYTKDLLVHGGRASGKATGTGGLESLRPGTTVAVHYTVVGSDASAREIDEIDNEGLIMTEGTVARVDRGRKQIAIRFDSGHTETFQLTERAAVDAGTDIDGSPNGMTRVIVYYADEAGRKVAHFFKKAP